MLLTAEFVSLLAQKITSLGEINFLIQLKTPVALKEALTLYRYNLRSILSQARSVWNRVHS